MRSRFPQFRRGLLITASAISLLTAACATSDDLASDEEVAAESNEAVANFSSSVNITLTRNASGGSLIAFGVPIPPNVKVLNASQIRVTKGGALIPGTQVREILATHNASGTRTGVRAVQVQFPASAMGTATSLVVNVAWTGGSSAGTTFATWKDAKISRASSSVAPVATRTIALVNGQAALVESGKTNKTLFTGREPFVTAHYPNGFLAATKLLGQQVASSELNTPARTGLKFMADNLANFGRSGMYKDGYAYNPDVDSIPDPLTNYEGWLYDRCATWLTAYTVVNDMNFLREGQRACSFYQSKIDAGGIFTGKPDPDLKYSHSRGLYAYYALTGDEEAKAAGLRIAAMWAADTTFVKPYAEGHLRGEDKLWTERLLATSMEGLYYGSRFGTASYLTTFKAMLTTSYKHITGTAADLKVINPWADNFPAQNCFVHTVVQHAEGDEPDPWCSIWMSELAVDVLLRWQEQSNDARVDEIFVRLTRAMRDFATSYTDPYWEPLYDTFTDPATCYDAADGENARLLLPLYGAGIAKDGEMIRYGESSDVEHCADATALTAAGIRALKRQGKSTAAYKAPFANEGDSFLALHQELAACAKRNFEYAARTKRNPKNWTASELSAGLSNPATFIKNNKIGYPQYPSNPQRKLSWWFNMSMMQQGMLDEAGVALPTLTVGKVQPAGCQ